MHQYITPPHHPRFSIIIPVYNTEKYLRQCIESILKQDFSDFELWLIDDGSTDNSGSICDSYRDCDNRVKVVHKTNAGVSSARNVGIEKANGEYVLFIDSDDYLKPHALVTFYNSLNIFPDAEYIKGNFYLLIDGKNELESIWKSGRSRYANRLLTGEEMLTKILKTEFFTHNSLYKRQFLEEHNLRFNEELTMLEDVVFLIRFCSFAKKCVFQPTETLTYRFSENSLLRGKWNLAKVKSLAIGSYYVRNLMPSYNNAGKSLLTKRYVEMAITAINQASISLNKTEQRVVLEEIKKYHKKLPMVARSVKHFICLALYNINPEIPMLLLSRLYR